MSLIRCQDVTIQFGEQPLLESIRFSIQKGDRVAILGRNGAGKSTLLKCIQGLIEPDAGTIAREKSLKIAHMTQAPPQEMDWTVHAHVSNQYDGHESWMVDRVISLVNLEPEAVTGSLSGGQLRRLSLAMALVNEPDILLLDEPTNHLDVESIEWLEKFLLKQHPTLILITHDRSFMQAVASRVFEIDLGQLYIWEGDYQGFLRYRETRLLTEEKERALFDKRLSQEEAWIRQGIKARRTRNEGRVRALKKMREAVANRRQRQSTIAVDQTQAAYAGKLVIEAHSIGYGIDGKVLVDDFSTTILKGDKVGILGPNGCGKSTLINLLLGQLTPDQGSTKRGTQLTTAYIDQHRGGLNEHQTAIDNIADGATHVSINGKSQHVMSYLQDCLFSPQKARSLVGTFSGGERNRLLLAKLFARDANLLVLDEPTNDLDLETLEFLEDYLVSYTGTLLLVSHDRAFLDNVVTRTIAYTGDGQWENYVGGYEDYLRQRPVVATVDSASVKKPVKSAPPTPTKKLSYKDQRELNQLPQKIELLEREIAQWQLRMCEPDFFKQSPDEIAQAQAALAELEESLEHAYVRWSELEA